MYYSNYNDFHHDDEQQPIETVNYQVHEAEEPPCLLYTSPSPRD